MARRSRLLLLACLCTLTGDRGSDGAEPVVSAAARVALDAAAGAPATLWVFFDPAVFHDTARLAVSSAAVNARPGASRAPLRGDHPVSEPLLERIRATGARLRHPSRWLAAVSVEADAAAVERLARLDGVERIRPVGLLRRAGTVQGASAVPGRAPAQGLDSAFYGPNWGALRALRVPDAQRFGFTGKGVLIAILDSGFETRHESLQGRTVVAARDFVQGDDIVYTEPGEASLVDPARHGTQVWSLLGGYKPGTLVGPAHDARFLLAKVDREPGDTGADEDRWVAAAEWADSAGARIIHSSVVFRFDFTDRSQIPYSDLNGDITATTVAADRAARRGILVVTAIGDDGPALATLSAPADADSVLAVGATDAAGQVASFSSRGPTADGRRKPELAARGTSLVAASSTGLAAYDASISGTSFAAPLIAGSAAVLMEAWPNLSSSAVRNALTLAGSRATSPNDEIGHGVPDLAAAILYPSGLTASSVVTVDLGNVLTTLLPTFRWTAAVGPHPSMTPVAFRIEVATDSMFQNVVYVDSAREATLLTASRALRPAQQLWWRVIANALLDVQRVSRPMGPFRMPNWVRLVSPDPTQVSFVEGERPDLTWVPLTAPPPVGPLVYDVEILSNQTGQPVQPTIRNLTSSTVRVPQPLVPNQSYRWRVIARTGQGAADTVESAAAFVVVSTERPPVTLLQQNFPNPFPRLDLGAAETRIWFDLAERASVELAVFDLRARFVRNLIPAEAGCGTITLEPGYYGRGGPIEATDPCIATAWDGTDEAGRRVARGVYILRLRVNGADHYRRMLFLPD